MNVIESFNLKGKTALVTGCSKGIGKSMSIALAEAGANIIGLSSSSNYLELKSEVEKLNRTFSYYQVNLDHRNEIYEFLKNIENLTIDILVNNAGTIYRNPALNHNDFNWDSILNINLTAPFIITKSIAQQMLRRNEGKIIFTCSLLSFQGGINVPSYTASKSALAGLIKSFANEWASKGICVNGIAPGYIDTDNTFDLRNDAKRSQSILERIPTNRWGNPDDFKGPIVFLASNASNYVNGTILLVDGGWMGR
ncbi:MAG: SDR family NAD(P)-dependent oxidoreductase [Sediminibacterium sp.]|nr:SDR family NAD(P)-dependent oxidoreductase [Sediminibacterium sp.]